MLSWAAPEHARLRELCLRRRGSGRGGSQRPFSMGRASGSFAAWVDSGDHCAGGGTGLPLPAAGSAASFPARLSSDAVHSRSGARGWGIACGGRYRGRSRCASCERRRGVGRDRADDRPGRSCTSLCVPGRSRLDRHDLSSLTGPGRDAACRGDVLPDPTRRHAYPRPSADAAQEAANHDWTLRVADESQSLNRIDVRSGILAARFGCSAAARTAPCRKPASILS